ncbi:uncharacterized protein LOC123224200 [Mangifera indica]|uniref:uncharacterized protein LOC123224200 n=1 Tax=Mangifera indica TaxID=29780 RepID=UPI001CF930E0|nr:uncharacterized protein LOC123224200 [Mangifera indica]
MATQFLEITLISAQHLKLPSNSKRMQTYALVWVDSSARLRTGVDRVGGENPTWNDKFLFKVTPEFLSSETSAVSIEIYACGTYRDYVVGFVRALVSNISLSEGNNTPSFTALQIRRPSGKFRGVLNIGAMLVDRSAFAGLNEFDAIGYRDLMGESETAKKTRIRKSKSVANDLNSIESRSEMEISSCAGSPYSDGYESTASSSSTPSMVLKDLNGNEIPRNPRRVRSKSTGMLCGLLYNKKNDPDPSDVNFDD